MFLGCVSILMPSGIKETSPIACRCHFFYQGHSWIQVPRRQHLNTSIQIIEKIVCWAVMMKQASNLLRKWKIVRQPLHWKNQFFTEWNSSQVSLSADTVAMLLHEDKTHMTSCNESVFKENQQKLPQSSKTILPCDSNKKFNNVGGGELQNNLSFTPLAPFCITDHGNFQSLNNFTKICRKHAFKKCKQNSLLPHSF